MAWPSSAGLSKANFDAGTDSPANARAELEALYDHVLLISNEVTDSATVWHSGNDGATSGLDADLLDGQHGSYYQDASNLNAGTIPLARIPATLTGKSADQLDGQEGTHYLAFANMTGTVGTSQIADDAVTNAKLEYAYYSGDWSADAVTENLPSGWSVTKPVTGRYTLTHNLGTTNYSIVAIAEGGSGETDTANCTYRSKASNTVDIYVNYWIETDEFNTTANPKFVDRPVNIIIVMN